MNHRQALELLWKDVFSVTVKLEMTDPETMLTGFGDVELITGEPCKLSFESLTSAEGDEEAKALQSVKLFCSPDINIPEGSKITVIRKKDTEDERTFTYSRSGAPGVFSDHQEIPLEKFREWA